MAQWLEAGWMSAGCAGIVAAIGLAILFRSRSNLIGTTLLAPWYWTVVSILAVAGTEVFLGLTSSDKAASWHISLRFLAATTVFCPVMSVLGAKRPQDKPWQFIVLSLWVVLILPAAEQLLLQPNQPLEIHGLRSCFLFLLIMLSFLNSIPTRFWPSSLLLTAAQTLLLAPYLPASLPQLGSIGVLTGLSLAIGAIMLSAIGFPRRRSVCCVEDRLWLDFRDSFGMLWGMRVWERINAAIEVHGWKIVMSWHGFRALNYEEFDGRIPAEIENNLRRTIKNLLRRFVSPKWIANRLEKQ